MNYRLMALGFTKMGTPVPILLQRQDSDKPPSYEGMRFFKRIWIEDRFGKVVKVHKDNIGGLRPGDRVATDVDAQKIKASA
jgi:hypothetical protein